MCWHTLVSAQVDDEVRIGLDEQPDSVWVAFYLIDVHQIDDQSQTMNVDFALAISWFQPELAGIFDVDTRVLPGEVDVPAVDIVNNVDLEKRTRDSATVSPNGRITVWQRWRGPVSIPMDFREFPMDHHVASLWAFVQPGVTIVPYEEMTGRQPQFTIADWRLGEPVFRKEIVIATRDEIQTLRYQFEVRRRVGYYVWKVILPLMLIVFMSWLVFWVDPKQIAPQVTLAATSMLTLIAYRFVVAGIMPEVSYLTRFDKFTLAASTLVFFALVEVVMASSFASLGKDRTALLIDRWSRVVFPAAFLILIIWSFWL